MTVVPVPPPSARTTAIGAAGAVLAACAALLPGSIPAAAAAGTPPGAAVLDSLYTVEEIVVWGDRVHAVTDYASRVDLVDRDRVLRELADPGANVLSALDALPGLTYRKAGLVASGASGNPPAAFRVRGVGSIPNDGLLVLVDGRPQYVGLWGHALPDAHRLGPVERIEVVRGPASVQYGSQAFAGVVNIVTRGRDRSGGLLQAAGGSHGTWNLVGDQRLRAGPVRLGLSGSRAATDGYRGGDASRVDGFRADAALDLSAAWRLSVLADGSDTAFDNPGPEGLPADDSSPYADPDFGSGDIRQRAVDLSLDGRGDGWTARLKLYHNYVHNDFYREGNTRARDHGLRLFGELRRERWSAKGGFDLERYGGNFAVNGNPGFVPVDAYDLNAAPYLLARYDLTRRLSAAGGLRLALSDRYATEWVPQLRLRAALDEATQLTLAASKGYKTPSVAEQYLPFFAGDRTLLAPERLWQYELGLARHGARGSAELALYHSEGDNLIREAVPGWPPVYDNSGAFRHQGVELTLRTPAVGRRGAILAAAWMLARDDQTLATPAATYRLDLWTRPHPRLRLDTALEAELDRFGADGHRDRLPDLYLVSAGLGWTLPWNPGRAAGGGAELFVRGRNLTDRAYRIFSDYPMPRLTWSVGLRVTR